MIYAISAHDYNKLMVLCNNMPQLIIFCLFATASKNAKCGRVILTYIWMA